MNSVFNASLLRETSWKLKIWLDPYLASDVGALPWQGWRFVARPAASETNAMREIDRLEDSFAQIIGYAEDFQAELDWRDSAGNPVDLRTLQPSLNASERWANAIERWSHDNGKIRCCTNLFSDGDYRITIEKIMTVNGMSWWQPKRWSEPYRDEVRLKLPLEKLVTSMR